ARSSIAPIHLAVLPHCPALRSNARRAAGRKRRSVFHEPPHPLSALPTAVTSSFTPTRPSWLPSNDGHATSGCWLSAMATPSTRSETATAPSPPQSPRQAAVQLVSTYCHTAVVPVGLNESIAYAALSVAATWAPITDTPPGIRSMLRQ